MQFVSVGGNFTFNLHDLYLMSKLPVHANLHHSVQNPSLETSKIKSVNVHAREFSRSGSYRFNVHACGIDRKS